ncbi:MAG: DUF1501 domain-containing protein [Pirellulaceae bacterium]
MQPISINRRQMLGGSIGGFFAYAARNHCDGLFASEVNSSARAKRCIVLWMDGGPSQLDTFDPKPGTSTGGEFQSIETAAPGMRISETLPRVARQMDALSIVRNLTSDIGDHQRAQYYLHTGYQFVSSFPRPSLGSVISSTGGESALPNYVALGSAGYGPAFMGPEHAPFSIENAAQARQLLNTLRRRRGRLRLLGELGSEFDAQHPGPLLEQRKSMISRIGALSATQFSSALDLEQASPADRSRYGDSEFARNCLVARRLLDLGVRFVEIQRGGWDTHDNNFRAVRRLTGDIDRPLAALMEDLRNSGMLEDTIVIWMGEFGRTPRINGRAGRDHFPRVTPVVLGGGPIQGGRVIGGTNELGTEIQGEPWQVPDLFATIMSAFGVEPDEEFTTDFDSPTTATDGGRIIEGLL